MDINAYRNIIEWYGKVGILRTLAGNRRYYKIIDRAGEVLRRCKTIHEALETVQELSYEK